MGFRKSVLIASVSVFAVLGMVSPALAQEAAPATAEEEEIVVTGIRGSITQSIDAKRESDVVVDVLTAEDVGKFPDHNVAEALQRVPGVQINREFGEGERVSVRGLPLNLTRTLLNGHSLATADWFILDQLTATRGFNYLMLPSEVIGQVQVMKSPTAATEEGGVGATIDVRTRNPLDLDELEIAASVQAAYTENSDSTDPQASGLFSWRNDAGTLGFLIAGVYQERNIRRDGVEVLGYFPFDHDGDGANPNPTPPLQVPALIGSALFEQERIRKGGNFALQFRPNDQWDVNLTGLYSHLSADNFNQNFLAWPTNAVGGGATLSNMTIIDDTIVAATVSNPPAGIGVVFDAIDRIAHAETRNIDFDANFTPNEDWRLHFKVGYTDAEGVTDRQHLLELAQATGFTYDLRGSAPQVSFADIDPTVPSDLRLDFANMPKITNEDSEFYTYFDISRSVDFGALTEISAGVKYTDHDRSTEHLNTLFGAFVDPLFNAACGGPCTPDDFAGALTPGDFLEDIAAPGTLRSYFQIDRATLQQLFGSVPDGEANRVIFPADNFDIEEKTLGGYVLGRFEGEDWRGNIGVRVVETTQTTTGNLLFGTATGPGIIPNPFSNFMPATFERSYVDILPSANFAFDLTNDLVFRFAAARVMARPDYTDIVPRTTLNVGALSGSGGDPDIDPFRANQFDFSVEYYPTRDSIFAAGLFYKDIQSFITSRLEQDIFTVETTTPNLARCTPAGGSNPNLFNCLFDIDRRINGGGGRVQGVELNAQTAIWGGFGVLANYTYSDGQTDEGDALPGNSDHTFNVTGYFENDLVSARLSYTFRSEFFVQFDRANPLNQDGVKSLDASASFNVTPQIALTFDAINLTDEEIVQFSGDTFRPRAIFDNGRQFYFGARYRY